MARRRSKRSRRGAGGSGVWYFAILICLLLVIGIGVGSQMLLTKGQIDEATLCHDGGAKNVTIMLLDLTDPLGATQQARLQTILSDEIDRSSVDTMFALGVVSEDAARWGSAFAKCKPATGEAANGLYENPALIAQRYSKEFLIPVEATLKEMMTATEENQSPIMEALQALVAETPDFTRVTGDKKLIIVSDMLQHSKTLSFYRGQDWEFFAADGGPKRLARSLRGVDVEILRIPRAGSRALNDQLVDGFWARYFDIQGTRTISASSLGDL